MASVRTVRGADVGTELRRGGARHGTVRRVWGTPSPDVSVVIATRDRVELLRQAVAAALAQDYPGGIEVVAVFDQSPPVRDLEADDPHRTVRVLTNRREPGLAGARNHGILAATRPLVAFCDDDDTWVTHKLRTQVEALGSPGTIAAVGGIEIHYGGEVSYRVPCVPRITADDLARSRLTGAHPSTYLIRRDVLVGPVGLVDERLPYGYGEDYDLLIRLARHGAVAVVQAPLAVVRWHSGSFFAQRWRAMADGLGYLLDKHPELRENPAGHAWVEGQRAFALAALGDRAGAWRSAIRSLRLNPREPRGVLALLVSTKLVSARRVMRALNARGRGI
jgi:GT2 family glycosyltransferase